MGVRGKGRREPFSKGSLLPFPRPPEAFKQKGRYNRPFCLSSIG
jgi:hypothetical protein